MELIKRVHLCHDSTNLSSDDISKIMGVLPKPDFNQASIITHKEGFYVWELWGVVWNQ